MDTTNNELKFNPYSLHFRCHFAMIKNRNEAGVLQYIIDEHFSLVRREKPDVIAVSQRTLVQQGWCSRGKALESLENLEKRKLITRIGSGVNKTSLYKFNAQLYYSLIDSFNKMRGDDKLELKDKRILFSDALDENDFDKLEELGFIKNPVGKHELEILTVTNQFVKTKEDDIKPKTSLIKSGWHRIEYALCSLLHTMCCNIDENEPLDSQAACFGSTGENQVARFCTTQDSQVARFCTTQDSQVARFCTTENSGGSFSYHQWPVLVSLTQIYNDLMGLLLAYIEENYTKKQLKDEMNAVFGFFIPQNDVDFVADCLFGDATLMTQNPPEKWWLMLEIMLFSRYGVAVYSQDVRNEILNHQELLNFYHSKSQVARFRTTEEYFDKVARFRTTGGSFSYFLAIWVARFRTTKINIEIKKNDTPLTQKTEMGMEVETEDEGQVEDEVKVEVEGELSDDDEDFFEGSSKGVFFEASLGEIEEHPEDKENFDEAEEGGEVDEGEGEVEEDYISAPLENSDEASEVNEDDEEGGEDYGEEDETSEPSFEDYHNFISNPTLSQALIDKMYKQPIDMTPYETGKVRDRHSYFNQAEIEDIFSASFNPHKATKVELFIRILWSNLESEFPSHYDEDGNLLEMDLQGKLLDRGKLPAVIKDSLQPFEDYAVKGCLDFFDDELEFGEDFQPVTYQDALAIIDWEDYVAPDHSKYYIVNKFRFVNILSEELPEKPYSALRSPEARAEDYEYMQKVILAGDSDEGYEMLTAAERGIYEWMVSFIEIDEEGKPISVLNGKVFAQRQDYAKIMIAMEDKYNMNWGDFRLMLFRDNKGSDNIQLYARQFVHSYVQYVHKKYGQTSKIDLMTVDEIKSMVEGK